MGPSRDPTIIFFKFSILFKKISEKKHSTQHFLEFFLRKKIEKQRKRNNCSRLQKREKNWRKLCRVLASCGEFCDAEGEGEKMPFWAE